MNWKDEPQEACEGRMLQQVAEAQPYASLGPDHLTARQRQEGDEVSVDQVYKTGQLKVILIFTS